MLTNEENLSKLGSVFLIEVDKIKPNSQQPRTEFDEERLKDLAESIKQYGVLQPLIVTRKETETPSGVSVEYELIAGERRLRASKMAGLSVVPVVIRRESDDKMKLELAIIENLQREDLNAIERALAFKKLADNFKLKHHEIAQRVGKSREYVSNTIRLLALPQEIQNGLIKGEISEGHCRTILMLEGRLEDQLRVYKDVVDKKMTVRQTERVTKNIINNKMAETDNVPSWEIKSIERKLSDTLGTKVQIAVNGGKGTIFIDFFSNEELNSFISKVAGEKLLGAAQNKSADQALNGGEKAGARLAEEKIIGQVPVSSVDRVLPVNQPSEAPQNLSEVKSNDNLDELIKSFTI